MTKNLLNPTDEPHGRRWGCLVYSLSAVVVGVMIVATAYFVWYGNAAGELDSEIARILERGEPLWFSDLDSTNPPPPEDDATALFMAAVGKQTRLAQGFYDLLDAQPPTKPGKYEAFATELEANRPALELLAQAVKRPYFRMPVDYQTKQTFGILLQPIQDAREFSRLLKADVLQSLGSGDQDRALAALQENLGLAELLRNEPFIISHLVRYAIGAVALESLEVIIENTELTTEQFAAIDEQLDRMFRDSRAAPGIIAERCMAFTVLGYLEENKDQISDKAEEMTQWNSETQFLSRRLMKPYLLQERANLLRVMREYADVADQAGENAVTTVMELASRVSEDNTRGHRLTKQLTPFVPAFRGATLRFRQRLLNARLALRIARYRAEHGELPRTLAEILDDKLARATDAYSGLPLVYEFNSDGFLIHPSDDALAGSTNPPGQKPEDAKRFNTFKAQFKKSENSAPREPREY